MRKRVIALAVCAALLACALAFFVFIMPREARYAQYPLRYVDVARRNADMWGLETERVLAVMLCESSFRPDAVSGAGAVGLMQVMPDTGRWIAGKLGEEATYTDAALSDPDVNARYGCWYLAYLDERFGGDLVKSTAAYHAGPGRVDEWLGDKAISSDGATLENIPSRVTDAYVQNVLTAREMYGTLYDQTALDKAASEET